MKNWTFLLVAIAVAQGCSINEPTETWLLVAVGNRLNPTSVSTKFAVPTLRTFGNKSDCVAELYRLSALGVENQLGIVDDEHQKIRLDYACIRTE